MNNDETQVLVKRAAEAEDKRAAEELIQIHEKILTAAYDKAAAYTNLIFIGGYAGFFGLWQLTKDHLAKAQVLWAALFMLMSIITFVLFEVWKMYYSSRGLLGLGRIMSDPENQKSIKNLLAEIEKHSAEERKRVIWFGRVWHVALIVALFTGLAAAAILCWAFVMGLLKP
jgi:hypothetical protein